MSFWQRLVNGGASERSHQLPSSMVAQEFGEVNVRRLSGETEVIFTILMQAGTAGEGWQTGVAIDASGSMQSVFGKGIEPLTNDGPPNNLLQDYHRRGWLQLVEHQGQTIPILSDEARYDLVNRGYFRWTQNEIQPFAQSMTAYLADNLDSDGGTTVIYWACGDGSQIEELGDFTARECESARFTGPSQVGFGSSTVLTPAVRYFVERFADAPNGMYIFLTDGELNDLNDVKAYTVRLCREIEARKRNPVKCVLIGIGDEINEEQMEELDDLESGTNVDIWDHKIAREMRGLIEIFAEVVSENQIVAPSGRILDASGAVVKQFPDGVPAKITFRMPASSNWFDLDVAGQRIRQSIVQ